jgi:type II secretory ATPase GspE/PulE/Tfp pilus assembly ATPase PilB-like protein
VRTLAKDKKVAYNPTQEEFAELMQEYGLEHWGSLGLKYSPEFTLQRPPDESPSGYKGRMGIHELLLGTDEMKRAIQKKATVEKLRQQAQVDGMRTLLQDGIEKAIAGHTDFKQVRAVCIK